MSEQEAGLVPGPDVKAQSVAVQSAIEQILEEMYFCEADYLGPALMDTACLGAVLAFSGDLSGEFKVAVSENLATRMATDFLALPYECLPEQIEAIVREFGNIACGASMSAWKPHASFHYSVPGPLSRRAAGVAFAHCFSVSGLGADLAVEISVE